MNQKILVAILGVVIIFVIGILIYFVIKNTTRPLADLNIQNNLSDQINITYLISNEEDIKYCNGADMDSEGYKKTINTEVVSDVPKTDLSEAELVKETAVLATSGMCQDVLRQLDFNVANGVVEIPPIDGWAGASIVMCTCKPQVEVNLLRIPNIKQVIWLSN